MIETPTGILAFPALGTPRTLIRTPHRQLSLDPWYSGVLFLDQAGAIALMPHMAEFAAEEGLPWMGAKLPLREVTPEEQERLGIDMPFKFHARAPESAPPMLVSRFGLHQRYPKMHELFPRGSKVCFGVEFKSYRVSHGWQDYQGILANLRYVKEPS